MLDMHTPKSFLRFFQKIAYLCRLMSKIRKPRRKVSKKEAAPSGIQAALPPLPVNAAVLRARLFAVTVLSLAGIVLLVFVLRLLPEGDIGGPPAKPDVPFVVEKRFPAPDKPGHTSRRAAPEEPAGINLSIASREAEEKEDALSARQAAKAARVSAKKAVAENQKEEPPKIVVKKKEIKPKIEMEIKEKPGPFDADMARADTLIDVKDWKGAYAVYRKILEKDRGNKAALQGAVFVLEKRSAEDAIDGLDFLTERYPDEATLHAARARILVRQNDTLEALKAWERAVRLDSKNNDYRLGLAVLNDRLGNEEEALRLYKQLPKPLSVETKKRIDYLSNKLSSAK